MRVRLSPSILFTAAALSFPSAASAHFNLDAPPSSGQSDNGGEGGPPCGPDSDSPALTPVRGGTMIDVRIDETDFHPGHYRIAIGVGSSHSLQGDPIVKDADGKVLPFFGPAGISETATIQDPPVFPVLADNVFPHTTEIASPFLVQVMVPNFSCGRCTLQVIQFLSKHGPDYFHRHCASIRIDADPNKLEFDPYGRGGSGAAGGSGGAATAGTGGQPAMAGEGGAAGDAIAGGGAAEVAGGAPGAPANPMGLPNSGCSCSAPTGRNGSATLVASTLLLRLGLLRRRWRQASTSSRPQAVSESRTPRR